MDRSCIQAIVEKEIQKSRYKYDQVPGTTMKRHIHDIMSHPSFNVIQTAVSNKTDLSSSTKLSTRSTISYFIVVLVTYCVYAEPSQFRPELNSLDPTVSKVRKLVKILKRIKH